MKTKSLKSVLKFWQEILFVVPIGILLVVMVSDVFMRQTSMFDDGLGIATFCFLLFLFICLIGQFFWKNENLSICLTPLLVLYSLFWVFVSIYLLIEHSKKVPLIEILIMVLFLVLALFLVFAAITMPRKYNSTINKGTFVKQ